MKCPLSAKIDYMTGDTLHTTWSECLKEECAWWSSLHGWCDMNSIAQSLWELKNALRDILEKMPHAEQFTR